MKKLINMSLVFFSIVLLLQCLNVKALDEYIIDKFDVSLKVNEDNTYDVYEIIDVHFRYSFKEFNIRIPATETINKKINSEVQITNLKINGEDYQINKINDEYDIKIKNTTLEGKKQFIISYTYKAKYNNSVFNKFEGVYYNLVGQDWSNLIKEVDFQVFLPDSFKNYKIDSFRGLYDVEYEVKDNVITGSYTELRGTLPLKVELQSDNRPATILIAIITTIIPLVCLGLAILIWYKRGRDNVVETIEFYPPEGLNSLEVGFIINDGLAKEKDVLSLLIYLTNKGYLKIERKKSDYKFIKLKDYDGVKIEERMFLEGLFENASKDEEGNLYVLKSSLGSNFVSHIEKIKNNINSSKNYKKLYEDKMAWVFQLILGILYLISIITTVSSVIYPLIEEVFALIIYIPMFIILICTENAPIKIKRIAVFLGILILGYALVKVISLENLYILIKFIIGMACSIGIIVCLAYLDKRTKEGALMLGKIRGFKRFLQTVEKDKLESLIENDKDYFLKILPYLYVLELSDKWMKDFEEIIIPNTNKDDILDMESFISDCMPTIVSLVVLLLTSSSN